MMRETLARVDEGAFRAGRWDAWGQALSVLCMAHCVLLPLALGALPAVMSQSLEDAPIHLGVLALQTSVEQLPCAGQVTGDLLGAGVDEPGDGFGALLGEDVLAEVLVGAVEDVEGEAGDFVLVAGCWWDGHAQASEG